MKKSGPTQSNAARREAGRVRLSAWLELDVYERLATRAALLGITKSELIAKLVRADTEPTQ